MEPDAIENTLYYTLTALSVMNENIPLAELLGSTLSFFSTSGCGQIYKVWPHLVVEYSSFPSFTMSLRIPCEVTLSWAVYTELTIKVMISLHLTILLVRSSKLQNGHRH